MKNQSAGKVVPSKEPLIVTDSHEHLTLKDGDTVIMVESPNLTKNLLFRCSDATLHVLADPADQYVHLSSCIQP